MEAIVLAGEFGTCLAHSVSNVPKSMTPVCERPFLRFVLDNLQAKGVERIVLAVGYGQDVIRNFFGTQYRGMELLYSPEETLLSTGGAIKKALRLCRDERVWVVRGDTYLDADLKTMMKEDAPLVMAVKSLSDASRYGTVVVDNGRIVGFREKGLCAEGLINGGIYLIRRELLETVPETSFSLEQEILEARYETLRMVACESEGDFIDIGVPDGYALAQESMKALAPMNKAAFFDRDGTINVDVHYLYRPEEMQFIEGIPEFIRKWNDWGYKVIVVTNQAGIARGYYTEEDMRILHRYMNERLAEYGAHIDAFYFCPHHPDFTGSCRCRKPKPGMIEDAIRDFDLIPEQCILFGDKERDVLAAERCGVRGMLVPEETI